MDLPTTFFVYHEEWSRFFDFPKEIKILVLKTLIVLTIVGTLLFLWFISWLSKEVPCYPADRIVQNFGIDFKELHQIYKVFDTVSNREWIQLVHAHMDLLQIEPGSRVFDSGCGSGAFLDVLQRDYNVDITGADYDTYLINLARSRVNGTFYVGDPRHLGFFPSEQFDYVFSFNMFQYFKTKKDIRYAVSHLARLAKFHAPIVIGFVNNESKRTANLDLNDCPQNVFIDKDFWRDLAWEFGLEDLQLVSESYFQSFFGHHVSGSWYQYSIYCKKGGIIHG